MTVLEVRGLSGGSWMIAAVFAVVGLILLGVAFRFLRALDRATRLGDVLRTPVNA